MAWINQRTAAVGVAAVIILSFAITGWLNSGLLGPDSRVYNNGINKAHGLPDPLFTYPAGDEKTHGNLEALLKKWRPTLDPAYTLKSDSELTEQDIRYRTIYIYGSPQNHSFFRRVRDQLPLVFENDGVVVGKKKCLGRDAGAIFACPNPINPNNRLVIYGAVSPEAIAGINGIFHGPTDYVVFNNTTRQFPGMRSGDRFLLEGAFDKSDSTHWQVDEKLQIFPPRELQNATLGVIVNR